MLGADGGGWGGPGTDKGQSGKAGEPKTAFSFVTCVESTWISESVNL